MILGFLTQLSIQTHILLTCHLSCILTLNLCTHSLPHPLGGFFFFPFKYLNCSHCGFFPVHSRTVSMPSLLLFPFLFMKSLKRGENKLGICYGPEMNSVAFSMFCLCPPHLQVIVTVWKQPTGSGNALLFLSKLFKFWVHTTFFSLYIIFFFFPPLPLNLRVEVSQKGKS